MPEAVEFVGVDPALSDMTRWADQVGPAVVKASRQLADRVAWTTRDKVPVLTGTLAWSVEVDDDELGVSVGIGDGVIYAGWIEFGGSRGRAYIPEGRYLYPTAVAGESDYQQLASDTAVDTAERFSWSTPA